MAVAVKQEAPHPPGAAANSLAPAGEGGARPGTAPPPAGFSPQQGFGDDDDDAGKCKWDTSSDSEMEQIIKSKRQKTDQDAGKSEWSKTLTSSLSGLHNDI